MSVAGNKPVHSQPKAAKVAVEPALARSGLSQLRGQVLQSRAFWCAVGALGMLVLAVLWVRLFHDSPAVAQARANDERLLVEPGLISLDGLRVGEKKSYVFHVTNVTDKKITLRWSQVNTSFIDRPHLPVDIAPGERKAIELPVLVPHKERFVGYVTIHTSDEIRPVFFVRVAGQVTDSENPK